jgi:hypothetical protein
MYHRRLYSPKRNAKERRERAKSRITIHNGSLEKRMRRVAITGRFFEKPQKIAYLWTNWLYPFALVIALIGLLWSGG